MADALQALATFPGIDQIVEASFTLSHGITPSVAMIEMAPQEDFIGEGGTLSFFFDGVEIDFPDCKVDWASFEVNQSSGNRWHLSILDRRWKWAFGTFSLTANTRAPDGTIDPVRQKDAQTIAALCLQAMNEQGFDVSLVPGNAYPLVEWDHENPARALASLCDELGLRIVLRLDNTVGIYPLGQGDDLPVDLTVMANSLTINPPEIPDSLLLVGGVSRFQMDFFLEPVGLDVNGAIVPINNLSYMPKGGWAKADWPDFESVAVAWRSLAEMSVYKWYRICANTDGSLPLFIPGYGAVYSLWQILPIEDVQVLTFADGDPASGQALAEQAGAVEEAEVNVMVPNPILPDAEEEYVAALLNQAMVPGQLKRSLPAVVYGIWDDGIGLYNTDQGTVYGDKFEIDREFGIVKFEECLLQIVNPAQVWVKGELKPVPNWDPKQMSYKQAELYLRCAVSVRDPVTWSYHRYEKLRDLGGTYGTGPFVVRQEDLALAVVPQMDAKTLKYTAVYDNRQRDLNPLAEVYLDKAQLEFQVKQPYEITYAGIKAISPDGAVQQVTWTVGSSGATTRASYNNEHSTVVPGFQERRIWEQVRGGQLRALARTAQRIQNVKAFGFDL